MAGYIHHGSRFLMKRISDVVVCESKRLDGLTEFAKRVQTVQLPLQAFMDPIQIGVNKPQNDTFQIVPCLPHCTYFPDFAEDELWMLYVSSYLA